MFTFFIKNGGVLPKKQSEAWASLQSKMAPPAEAKDWEDTLRTAETAALPAETLMESPEACERDTEKRMPNVTPQELDTDFTCFESRLIDPNINSDSVQRIVLLDQSVYHWCISSHQVARVNFASLLEGLKPAANRKAGVQATKISRRAIIGAASTYEVLAAQFEESSEGVKKTALFTPFVSAEVNGKLYFT